MLKRIILSSALGLGLIASAPTIASACMNAVQLEGNSAVQKIARAEKQLEEGKLNEAKRTLAPHRFRFSDAGHNQRAMLVLSAVEFRSAGASTANFSVQSFISGLESALKSKKHKDNPLLQARLAEGYMLDRKTLDKARLILNDLESRDLMPDAFGYRNLAILRAADKELKKAELALVSCRAMTKRKDVCSLTAMTSEKLKEDEPVMRSRSMKSSK